MSAFRGQVPNLVLAQRVIDKMAAAASRYIQDETGEAMIGLIDPGTHTNGVPTLYVLDTIAPDESDVVREYYSFEQGDDLQFEIFTWYLESWAIWRQTLKSGSGKDQKWDQPLIHIGDWHKQPGYMIAPSGGDLISAVRQLEDPEQDANHPGFLLVPIVTLEHPSTTQNGPGVNYLLIPDGSGSSIRVDFWYIHRDLRAFLPITPVVYPNDQLPGLPELPWHLTDEARISLELGQLQHEKWFVSMLPWNVDQKPPLELCLMAAQQGQSHVYLIVTQHDFPKSAPKIYRAPFIAMGDSEDLYAIFEKMWPQAELIPDPPGWKWSPDLYLIDYVNAVHGTPAAKEKDKDNASQTPTPEKPAETEPGGAS